MKTRWCCGYFGWGSEIYPVAVSMKYFNHLWNKLPYSAFNGREKKWVLVKRPDPYSSIGMIRHDNRQTRYARPQSGGAYSKSTECTATPLSGCCNIGFRTGQWQIWVESSMALLFACFVAVKYRCWGEWNGWERSYLFVECVKEC